MNTINDKMNQPVKRKLRLAPVIPPDHTTMNEVIKELTSINQNMTLRMEYAKKLIAKNGWVKNNYGDWMKERNDAVKWRTRHFGKGVERCSTPRVGTAFGTLWKDGCFQYGKIDGAVSEWCGIEVLGMNPNATERTYSRKCNLTIGAMKEACKVNGIKPKSTWNKTDYLHALMKA